MKNFPLVSVVMPVYNTARFLPEAIESVLRQTYPHFEFIIVDDASTDGSGQIIGKYAKTDQRIIFLKNQKNRYIAYSRNKGIKFAKGEYIAFLDSDDAALPDRLQKQVNYMSKHPDCGVCGSNYCIIDHTGKGLGEKKFPNTDLQIRKFFFYFNPIGQSSALIRKVCYERVGLYNDLCSPSEDLDMWIRIGSCFQLNNLPECLVKYRIHRRNSTFSSQSRMIKTLLEIRKKAVDRFGYKMDTKAKIAYLFTKGMVYLPSGVVFRLFNILRKAVWFMLYPKSA